MRTSVFEAASLWQTCARASRPTMHGIEVPPARAPGMIDEYPILKRCAVYAQAAKP